MRLNENLDEATVAGMSDEEIDRLPGSFAIEYLNAQRLREALSNMGASFIASAPIDENTVFAEGIMPDGTKIRIEATKGEKYQSPKDVARDIKKKLTNVGNPEK